MSPIVSIIMPAYNAERTIVGSIESVVAQTCPDWELIVVDDLSTDRTSEIVQEYGRDGRIRLTRSSTRLGYCGARNLAARLSSGRYVSFLDADDTWSPIKLERQLRYQEKNRCLISHTGFEVYDESGLVRGNLLRILDSGPLRRGFLLPSLYVRNIIGILTVMMDRELLVSIGGFDEEVKGCEDLDLWIRIAERGHKFGYLPEVLARYRVSSAASSLVPGRLEGTWMELLSRRVLENPRVSKSTKRRALGYYYLYFGYRHWKSGNRAVVGKFLRKAIRSDPFGPYGLIALPAWLAWRIGGRSSEGGHVRLDQT